MAKLLICLSVIFGAFVSSNGHGMVMDPPNRSSLWRFDPTAPINYNDNQMFCGGFAVQWNAYNGSCGVCGDPYADPIPRDNENTGKYGKGTVAKAYKKGEIIEVSVLITANHMGTFQFSICDLTGKEMQAETDDCFKVIKTKDGSDRWTLPSREVGYYKVELKLPEDLTCDRCVLRWHWNTGNSWGICENGNGALGCGAQETFRSCSDIAIL